MNLWLITNQLNVFLKNKIDIEMCISGTPHLWHLSRRNFFFSLSFYAFLLMKQNVKTVFFFFLYKRS